MLEMDQKGESDCFCYSSFLLPSWQAEHTGVSPFGLRRDALEFEGYSTGSFIHILAQ